MKLKLQFRIQCLLWLTLVVAAFLGGMAIDREIVKREGYVRLEFDEFERLDQRDF